MYKMVWDIKIGNYKLGLLESVEIHKSVDLLADTASIIVPGVVYNQSLDLEEKAKIGDPVTIRLGYDDNLETEFEGYLQRIDTDDNNLTFNCEDGIYLTRKSIPPKVFTKCKVSDVTNYCANYLGLSLNCKLDTQGAFFEKFVISPNDTVYNVLSKIQESTKANIYMKGKELNIHPAYIEKGGDVQYDFAVNIESSDLKYRSKNDRMIEVTVNAVGIDGKKKTITIGQAGGDKVTVNSKTTMTENAMKTTAENTLKYHSYDGYEGSITSWLIPVVEPTYSAHIHDKEYEFKTGSYYVVSVTTTFSDQGGVRKIELGIKLTGNG